MTWIDVHTHLSMIEDAPEATIAKAKEAGVDRMITIGTTHEDHVQIMDLVGRFQSVVYGTLGYHPHDSKDFTPEGERYMCGNLDHPAIVGVGEIGLDYYYDHSPREVQQQVFRKQLQIAVDKKLPVEIHTRDAEKDTVAILKEFSGRVTGLFHCFTGTSWLAEQGLNLGFNLSFSGVVTFKNADDLRAVVKSTPLDRLHVETDAPFLTPVPFRGKKNAPHLLVHTAETIAGIKGISMEELAAATNTNAKRLFKKLN